MTTPGTTGTCPTCGATNGNRCTTNTGNPAKHPHGSRLKGTPTPPGQPTKLTPKLTKRIAKHLRNGTTLTTAAQASGIGPTTLHRWLNQANIDGDDGAPFREFRDTLLRARAEGAAKLARQIVKAGGRRLKSEEAMADARGGPLLDEDGNILYKRVWEDDWKALAFVLERSWAQEWGKRTTVAVEHQDPAGAVLTGADAARELEEATVYDRLYYALRDAAERDRQARALEAGEVVEGVVEG